MCPRIITADRSYYEHEGNPYCLFHFATIYATACKGCQNPIVKDFVELPNNRLQQLWHPECYRMKKYWNVRIINFQSPVERSIFLEENHPSTANFEAEEEILEKAGEQIRKIWRTLSMFEDTCARDISDIFLQYSNAKLGLAIVALVRVIYLVDAYIDALSGVNDFRKTTGMESELRITTFEPYFV
jgi:hypothetical protein